jgi:hypothetical protein
MAKLQKAKVKGCKKGGRNRRECEAYRAAGTRLINKRKKLKRRIKRFPNDKGARAALAALV